MAFLETPSQLETPRLTLRQFVATDCEVLECIFADPKVMHFGPGIKTQEWVQNWLRDAAKKFKTFGYGPWALLDKSTQQFVGYCGLFIAPAVCGTAQVEIGYRLAQHAWGKGYATEAVTAVRDYAFNTLHLTRLIAMVDPQNTASLAVVKKAGMHYEREVTLDGYDHAVGLYAISADSTGQQ